MAIRLKNWLLHLKTWIALYGNIPKDIANHHKHVKQYFQNKETHRKEQIKYANKLIMSDIKLDSRINRDQQTRTDNKAIIYYPNGSSKLLTDVVTKRKEHENE